jgi:cytochrome c oxidase subunit 2
MPHAPRLAACVPGTVTRLRRGRDACRGVLSAGALLLAGCGGPQSTLDPAGRGAERIADLFWCMTAGAIVVWLAVISLAFYAIRVRPEAHSRRQANLLIIGGGAIIPTVVLTGLLAYGLALMPELLAPAPQGSLKIAVTGEQWWWRVRYLPPGGNGASASSFIWRVLTSSTPSGFLPSAARST